MRSLRLSRRREAAATRGRAPNVSSRLWLTLANSSLLCRDNRASVRADAAPADVGPSRRASAAAAATTSTTGPQQHAQQQADSDPSGASSSGSAEADSGAVAPANPVPRGQQQTGELRRPLPAAAAPAFDALAAAGAGCYRLLSSAPQLPPLGPALSAAGVLAGAVMGTGLVGGVALKAAMGDRFHAELHRGRLYVQFGVPSQGPPVAAGAVVVRPTGVPQLGNGAVGGWAPYPEPPCLGAAAACEQLACTQHPSDGHHTLQAAAP